MSGQEETLVLYRRFEEWKEQEIHLAGKVIFLKSMTPTFFLLQRSWPVISAFRDLETAVQPGSKSGESSPLTGNYGHVVALFLDAVQSPNIGKRTLHAVYRRQILTQQAKDMLR
jgi:hypothetical protein